MTKFFTGDTHFFHANIIKYCNRPYKTIGEMNEKLCQEWYDNVKPEDEVYHVGDVGFAPDHILGGLLATLPGKKFLVPGNHDNVQAMRKYFTVLPQCYELKIPDPAMKHGVRLIVLSHYAMRVWNKHHYGAWHFYGHSHGTLPDDKNMLSTDVGVDANNYKLVTLDDIRAKFKNKTPQAADHHKSKDL